MTKAYYCWKCEKPIDEAVYLFCKKRKWPARCIEHQPKSTDNAKKLYYALKKKGIAVELEKYDGYKFIDIAAPKLKLNIEVDGIPHNSSHQTALTDLKRTYHSFKKGYTTLRIPNSLVENNIDETVTYLVKFLNKSRKELERDGDF